MKLFNLIFLLSIFILITASLFVFKPNQAKSNFNPISDKNNFYQQLNLAIKTSQLNVSSFEVRDFNHQIEFYVSDNNQSIKVILSDQQDPFSQISSLQELIKTAKINQQKLKLVNLSSVHPYATFKNN
jgi:biopolymer transport protein ExbD